MKRVLIRTEDQRRAASVAIAAFLVGGTVGRRPPDPIHEWVTEGRRTTNERAIAAGAHQRPYSSCGDLAHAVLWCLGCRDEHLVNRDSDGGQTPWVMGVNISRLCASPAYVRATRGMDPHQGDVLHVQSPDHVSILGSRGAGAWTTCDYGQPYGMQRSRLAVRGSDGIWVVGGRRLVGWLDLQRVEYRESAIVPDDFDGAEEDDNPYPEDVGWPVG